ncbi:MAG: hypothetical protein PHX16_09275 [Syntrophaceticus sp.]|nr:hypothetical protein [Syntrophaceticus sp.]
MAKNIQTSNVCNSCGGMNDPLAESCIYCKKALPKIDSESFSNELLIEKTSEWISKSKLRYIKTGKVDANRQDIEIPNREIRAYADKYLTLLAYRAGKCPELNVIYKELKENFLSVKPTLFQNSTSIYLVVTLSFLVISMGILYLSTSAEPRAAKKALKATESLIQQGRLDEALRKSEEVFVPESYSDETSAEYDRIRNNIQTTIKDLKAEQDKQSSDE